MRKRILQLSGLLMLALLALSPNVWSADLEGYGPIALSSETVQRPGAIVWNDLLTRDVRTASAFYSTVFGWDVSFSPDGDYAYATLDGRPVAAFAAYDDVDGSPDGLWLPSAAVTDVDEAISRVESNGGKVIEPAENLPGRGRYVLIEDPAGAVLMLLRAEGGDPQPSERLNTWSWNELWTDDAEQSVEFYEAVLGYRSVAVKDTDGATYQVMGRERNPYASVVKSPFEDVEPVWLTYILVEDIHDTVQAVVKAGGQIVIPPQKDGFNADVAIVSDPTGGVFALQQQEDEQ